MVWIPLLFTVIDNWLNYCKIIKIHEGQFLFMAEIK